MPTALLLGFCFALLASSVSGACYQRKEYRDTTTAEWSLYREALMKLQNGSKTGWSDWDDFTNFHKFYSGLTHNNPMFLPWHRAFLVSFEQKLRSYGPRFENVSVPYWSWSTDADDPIGSPLFDPYSRFKGTYVKNRAYDCNYIRNVPSRHCLYRNYTRSQVKFYPSDVMAGWMVLKTNYADFSAGIGGGPHGMPHVYIGGAAGDLFHMHSPNDPLFWMIHASIDRLWYLWQSLDESRLSDFGGGNLHQNIPGLSITVGEVMNYETFCATYEDYSGDTILTRSALRARLSSNAEEPVINSLADVSSCLPDPLPDEWLARNKLNPSAVRATESEFHQVIARSKSSMSCATSSAVAPTNTDEVNNTTSTGTPSQTSQSIHVTSRNSIPAWGVGLLILGAVILVLVAVLAVLVMRQKM